MRQTVLRQLRRSFVPLFGENDPRNRTLWRGIKAAYLKTPRNQRADFLADMAWNRREWEKTRDLPAETSTPTS